MATKEAWEHEPGYLKDVFAKMKVKTVLGVDPGTVHTAAIRLEYDPEQPTNAFLIRDSVLLPNGQFLDWLRGQRADLVCFEAPVGSYGTEIGPTLLETCMWIGKYLMVAQDPYALIPRATVKSAVTGRSTTDDTAVNKALREVFGEKGTKDNPGGTYGLAADMWAALGVAYATLQFWVIQRQYGHTDQFLSLRRLEYDLPAESYAALVQTRADKRAKSKAKREAKAAGTPVRAGRKKTVIAPIVT